MPSIDSNGDILFTPTTVRVLANPGGAKHPTEPRPLQEGDVITFDDAMNGNIYWLAQHLSAGRMQSIEARHVERWPKSEGPQFWSWSGASEFIPGADKPCIDS